jgi:hypothetical protein
MKKRKWESKIRHELLEDLFMPRLSRIILLLKGKKPKKIAAKQKRALKRNLRPLIIKALKGRYEKELKRKHIRSFKLPEKSANEKKKMIINKVNRYDEKIRKFIYTLWKDRKTCLYVGQTKIGVREIASKRRPLKASKWLKIYEVNRTVHLDRYEGMALHIFAPKENEYPKYNKVHPPSAKKKCPFCRMKKRVDREIENAFVIVRKK